MKRVNEDAAEKGKSWGGTEFTSGADWRGRWRWPDEILGAANNYRSDTSGRLSQDTSRTWPGARRGHHRRPAVPLRMPTFLARWRRCPSGGGAAAARPAARPGPARRSPHTWSPERSWHSHQRDLQKEPPVADNCQAGLGGDLVETVGWPPSRHPGHLKVA